MCTRVNISNELVLPTFFHSINMTNKERMCSISNVLTFALATVVGGGLMFAFKTFNEDDTPVIG